MISYTFLIQIKFLAIQGYTQAYQLDEEQLVPLVRAWALENANLSDPDHPLTQALRYVWGHSFCTTLADCGEFQNDVTQALQLAHRQSPVALAMELKPLIEQAEQKSALACYHPARVTIERALDLQPGGLTA